MSQAKPESFLAVYDAAVTHGGIRADASQRVAAEAFDGLYQQLINPSTPQKRQWLKLKPFTQKSGGLYVWGDVGRGKSMLMDLFVETCSSSRFAKQDRDPPNLARSKRQEIPGRARDDSLPTRRIHFHAFMRDVHKRLFSYRQSQSEDALMHVVTQLAGEQRLLCLDELQVTDVTDAMILARLFAGLMDAGVTVVFTSNRHPRDLYQGGLQREQFLKFVDLLEARMPIVRIDGPEDYRLAQLKSMKRTYMYPRNSDSDDFLLESWNTLTHGLPNEPLKIEVDGRELRVDKHTHGVAWLRFPELCMRPLGAGDYLELCSYCHTILLQGIPKLKREDRNEAKRFVTLIDALYDHRVKLIATAETAPNEIYEQGDGTFEFTRTVSRLMEMQSESYLAAAKI